MLRCQLDILLPHLKSLLGVNKMQQFISIVPEIWETEVSVVITRSTFFLEGCELYTSNMPCHICLSTIYLVKIDKVYYENTYKNSTKIIFSDNNI